MASFLKRDRFYLDVVLQKAGIDLMMIRPDEEFALGVPVGWICKDFINKVVEDCVPKKRRRQGNRPVWMNKKMMRLIRKKRRMWRAFQETRQYQRWQEFLKVQKEVQQAVKKARRRVERKTIMPRSE